LPFIDKHLTFPLYSTNVPTCNVTRKWSRSWSQSFDECAKLRNLWC